MMPENENPSSLNLPPVPLPRAKRPSPWPFVALAALALAGWQWFDTHQKLQDVEQQVSQKLADFDTGNKEDRGAQKQSREQVEALQAHLGTIDGKIAEFQARSDNLQALYQDVARSREELALIEVEQAITLAGQQLQLAGNLPVAVLALQAADAQLARLDRPAHLPLRKALAKDLARLKALPFVDMAGISLRLEQVLVGIDKLPLASYGRPEKTAENQMPAADQAWWQRTGRAIWQEVKGLIRIQRFDHDEAPLLAPGQSYLLRENLKLRLLNARLALFARDQWTFQNELKVAQDMLARHFVPNDKAVTAARAALRQMMASEIKIDLPTLTDSQAALRSLRQGKEKQ
ncbi:MAG: uroporphyrinogen-III C-methyltransferase [Gammaproteobacteria bacterium]|nr:uroporphyrinogen-III C-methyltransferase [Gammaproteobacteria bacterium]MBU1602498.1 uroporphyrinogen-III C-methyltransferase [Gammaproteobacteria bacterium]MBU2433303.1 uroporphyrinogen-III C-methyltransferase [Gammaproteobacteria bacterium]MBU2451219.1 uroporphyrinogen-III C-methyltransferase [Gammaproteobacteria bacterium]